MPKSETEYELEAKEYISHLEPQVQKLAVKAIDDALAMQRSWRWIRTALNKKGYVNWNRWHFGLFFNKNFNASVIETMKREDEAEQNDLEEFFSALEDKENYCFPNNNDNNAKIEVEENTINEAIEEIPVFYHEPCGGYISTEEYKAETFKYYKYMLADSVFEKNIPAIVYGLKHNDIAEEYIDIYKEALSNYAGDINE